jgi:hypothetical protein
VTREETPFAREFTLLASVAISPMPLRARTITLVGDSTFPCCGFFRHLSRFADAVSLQHMKHEALPEGLPGTQAGTAVAPAERRKAVRYRLEVPLVFRWQGSERSVLQGDGVTRDISARGAYVRSVTAPPVGALVDVEVYLLGFREPKSRIKARMVVSRVDDSVSGCGRLGFSLVGDGFQLISRQVRSCA